MKSVVSLRWIGLFMGLVIFASHSAWAQKDEFADEFATVVNPASGAKTGLKWSGFLQLERTDHLGPKSPLKKAHLEDETRFRLKTSGAMGSSSMILKMDFIQNQLTGESRLDVREARILATPMSWLDLSLGKQVNTWGVGDMVFINDLFPKNWTAMFLGKNMEFLKEPANSYRATAYWGDVTFDWVHHPEFVADVTPRGCQFAVYNPNSLLDPTQASVVGTKADCRLSANLKANQPRAAENAVRVKLQSGSWEWALYGYRGFYKSPKGLVLKAQGSSTSLSPSYPRLQVVGGSAEGALGPGILSFEVGQYQSLDDKNGTDPLVANSASKGLVGYRVDLSSHLSLGFQSLVEVMNHYQDYSQGILGLYQSMGFTATQAAQTSAYQNRLDQNRYTNTLRLGFKAQQDTLRIDYFVYNRPQDQDQYQKLSLTKRLSDALVVTTGLNLFSGQAQKPDRAFGMLKKESNGFARVRFNY